MFNIYGIIMIIATFFNAVSQIMLKKSAVKTKKMKFWTKFLNKEVLTAYLIFGLVCLINLYAYRGVDFKYGGAINAVGQVFVLGLSVLFCNEKLSKSRVVGSIMIISGIFLLSL